MNSRCTVDLHVAKGDEIRAGHKPGIIVIAGCALYFDDALYSDDVTMLQCVREVVQVQIDAMLAAKVQPLPANAPAEELAAPFVHPPPDAEPAAQGVDAIVEQWIGENVEVKTEDGVKMFRLKDTDYAGNTIEHDAAISAAPEGERIIKMTHDIDDSTPF